MGFHLTVSYSNFYNMIYEYIIEFNNSISSKKNQEKRTVFTDFLHFTQFLVIPAGFEPTTRSLEGCCSIQLSYETITGFFIAAAKISN